jgi:hypothetical protein
MYGMTAKNPCDGFGTIARGNVFTPIYWESKFNKNCAAFNLNRIEDHQAEALSNFIKVDNAEVYVILGLKVKRGLLVAYVFDWRTLKAKYESKYSFWYKELETLPYNKVEKGIFTFENIIKT